MNDPTKEDLLYGFTIVPETYLELVHIPLNKKEKRKLFIYKIKKIIIEIGWFLFLMIGIILQISSLGYLAGVFFKMGVSS